MEKLTAQEEQVMLKAWQYEDFTVKDIWATYTEAPAYTTLASVVKNLEKKGYVSSRKVGTTLLYTPAIDQKQYKRQFMTSVVENYFKNSYKEMVTFFAKNEQLSKDDLREIIDLIEQKDE